MGVVPSSATRIVVVTESVGAQEFWADRWEVDIQDGGRTVKLFGTGSGDRAQRARRANLARDLGGGRG